MSASARASPALSAASSNNGSGVRQGGAPVAPSAGPAAAVAPADSDPVGFDPRGSAGAAAAPFAFGSAAGPAMPLQGAPAFTFGAAQPQPQSQPQVHSQAQPQPVFHHPQYGQQPYVGVSALTLNQGAAAVAAGVPPTDSSVPPMQAAAFPPVPQFDWLRAVQAAAAAHVRAAEITVPNETEEEQQRRQQEAAARVMQVAIQSGLFLDPLALAGLEQVAAVSAQAQAHQVAWQHAHAHVPGAAANPAGAVAGAAVPAFAFGAPAVAPQQVAGVAPQMQPNNGQQPVDVIDPGVASPHHDDDDAPVPPGQALLTLIEAYDWPRALHRLTSHPAEARVVGIQGRTALHVAAERDAPADVVRAILDAYPEATTAVGTSRMNPLHITCSSQHASVDVVRVLVDGAPDGPRGPVTSQKDVDGDTPLHAAVRCGAPIEVLEALLRYNPRVVRERDHEGLTPLWRLWVRTTVMLGSQEPIDAVRGRDDLTGELGEAWTKTELVLRVAYMGLLAEEDGDEARTEQGTAAVSASAAASPAGSAAGTSGDQRTGEKNTPSSDPSAGESSSPTAVTTTSSSASRRRNRNESSRTFRVLHASCAVDCPRHVVRIAAALYPSQLAERDEDTGRTPLMVAAVVPLYPDHDLSGDGYFDEEDDEDGGAAGGGDNAAGHAQQDNFSVDSAAAAPHVVAAGAAASAGSGGEPRSPSVLEIVLEAEDGDDGPSLGARRTERPSGRLPLALALGAGKAWESGGVRELLDAYPDAVMIPDPATRLYPFMTAAVASSDAANSGSGSAGGEDMEGCYTVYELLRANPELVRLGVPNADPIPSARSAREAVAGLAGMLSSLERRSPQPRAGVAARAKAKAADPDDERKPPARRR